MLGLAVKSHPLPLISESNASIPKYVDGHIHYIGEPKLIAYYAVIALYRGATIIGGRWGTMPQHV